VGRARGLVTALCQDWSVDEDAAETAVLLTSETVTNAIIHGRSEVRVCAEVTSGWVRVAVGDDNSRHPRLQPQDAEALDGRGLQILELAASRWGVVEDGVGKVVWFEVDRHRRVSA
jgi:anti-sigma regulatory factor (Ser/Thr protein kinase)